MIKKILKHIQSIYISYNTNKIAKDKERIIREFYNNGQIPWSEGYWEHKRENINASITDLNILKEFVDKKISQNYGYRIDERIVEYPWIFSRLSKEYSVILDAGSTFNFDFIVQNELIREKDLTIYTFYPEADCFFKNRINFEIRGLIH